MDKNVETIFSLKETFLRDLISSILMGFIFQRSSVIYYHPCFLSKDMCISREYCSRPKERLTWTLNADPVISLKSCDGSRVFLLALCFVPYPCLSLLWLLSSGCDNCRDRAARAPEPELPSTDQSQAPLAAPSPPIGSRCPIQVESRA